MKCKVCEKEFELKKENMQLVQNRSLSVMVNKNLFEAFDCPHCGCQNVVNERYINFHDDADESILNEPHGTD